MLYKREVLLRNQMGYFDKVEHVFIPTNDKFQSGEKLDVSYFQGMHAPYISVFRKHWRAHPPSREGILQINTGMLDPNR